MIDVLEAFEHLGIAAAKLASDRRVLDSNKSLVRMLGAALPAGEPIDASLSAIAEDTYAAPGTYRIDRNDHAAWLRLDVRPDGNGFVGVLIDVSKEHHALEAQASFYATRDRLLLDGKIGTWRYDPDAELYHFSSELSLGHENATQPVPVALLQLIQHVDDRAKDTEIRERIVREGGSANSEMRYREADGSWTHLNVHYRAGRKMPSGRFEILGISQNITAVAIARDEANRISERLVLALGAAQAGVFEFDYKARSFWVSDELKALIGSELYRQVSLAPNALFISSDQAAARAFIESAQSASGARSIDLRLAQPGSPRWVRFYFDVKKNSADGSPQLGVGLLIDIDDRKRQELALSEAQRAAEFANRTKTEFLANMSHELRTPLNAILGFSEMIERQLFGPIEKRYADYAHDIHKSGAHLLELVNDVLDLSKLEAGKLELRESEIDLGALIEDCLTLVRGRAEASGLRLTTNLSSSALTLRADARAVRQLLLNFLSNAVKFTPDGGSVFIKTNLELNGELNLSVSDTGIGMTPGEIELALAPFGQIDSKLARKQEGTGLGLPICRSLMELHGGRLTVTSEPNVGTTLTARFPAARAAHAMNSQRRSAG